MFEITQSGQIYPISTIGLCMLLSDFVVTGSKSKYYAVLRVAVGLFP